MSLGRETMAVRAEDAVEAVDRLMGERSGRSILVVEDDPDQQWSLARTLRARGHRVVGTGSGAGAAEILGRWELDLVLVAEDLPGTDGVEVSRRLHALVPDVPVVLMTSDGDEQLRIAARLAGAAACFVKPLAPESLREIFAAFDLGPSFQDC